MQQFATQPDYAVATPKKSKALLFAASGFALLALLIGAGYITYATISKSNATKQAQAFVSQLNKGNANAAYAMGSSSLHKYLNEAQFTDSLGDVTTAQPSFDKQSTSVNGSKATYVAFENGLPEDANGSTQATFTLSLVKSGLTDWKIDSVDVQ